LVEDVLADQSSRVLQSDELLRETIQRDFGAMLRRWLGIKPRQLVNVVRV
jgi:hypothetical protein